MASLDDEIRDDFVEDADRFRERGFGVAEGVEHCRYCRVRASTSQCSAHGKWRKLRVGGLTFGTKIELPMFSSVPDTGFGHFASAAPDRRFSIFFSTDDSSQLCSQRFRLLLGARMSLIEVVNDGSVIPCDAFASRTTSAKISERGRNPPKPDGRR